MSEVRDPAITLFGRKIPLPDCQIPAVSGDKADLYGQIQPVVEVMDECREATKMEVEGPAELEYGKQCNLPSLGEGEKNNQQIPTTLENRATVDYKPDEDCPTVTDLVCQEKAFKKPDKVLPCPRCNSLDTKFCYFNNYNMNQPRHFCKKCQRYWTAGGTMRNVPVGAGRRKNKHSFTQNRQIVSSDGVPISQVETLTSTSHQLISCVGPSPCLRPSEGTDEVLKSGTDLPLCESMATVLNLEEQKRGVETCSMAHGENGEEPSSSGSSLTCTTLQENEFPEKVIQMEQASLAPHGFTPPWAYSWNPGWNEMVYRSESSNPYQIQWGSPPMVAVPGFCTPSITVPIVPASYWGCMPGWDVRKWNSPLVQCTSGISPSSSDNSSPTLGKHSRDANLQGEEKTETFLWVPKTLRIDDPDEAAKSSIWATLGIKPDRNEPVLKGGIFKAFQSKTEGCAHTSDADQILQANPAALSRSHTFQEST